MKIYSLQEIHDSNASIISQWIKLEDAKQIQLDAMKEGMRRAATVCGYEAVKHDMNWAGSRNCATAILTAVEQLTIEQL